MRRDLNKQKQDWKLERDRQLELSLRIAELIGDDLENHLRDLTNSDLTKTEMLYNYILLSKGIVDVEVIPSNYEDEVNTLVFPKIQYETN